MRIDAHQHYWAIARGDYGWLTPALAPIYRDFGPADLEPLLERHGISGTILVQAAPTSEETRYLLQVAAVTPSVLGVVGWADFSTHGAAAQIERFALESPLLVGLRPMLQDIADPDWILEQRLAPALEAMALTGLVFDALVLPRHLSRIAVLADRHPNLSIVVDHGAKPALRSGQLGTWSADIAALAARSNVVCKISGLVTEAGEGWTETVITPVIEHLIASFGPDRLLWGSDWPVLLLAATYDRWFALCDAATARLSAAEIEAVLGGNAARVYLSRRGRRP